MRNVRLVPFAPNYRRPSLNSSRSDFYLRTLAKEEMWRWPDLEKSDVTSFSGISYLKETAETRSHLLMSTHSKCTRNVYQLCCDKLS